MIKYNIEKKVICNSTEAAIKRWVEHYGEVNRENLMNFFGISLSEWENKFKPNLGRGGKDE